MAHVTKSAKCMSTTGTRPVIAAPIAEPTIAASEIGAFRTRSAPNSSRSPFVSASPKSMLGTSVAPGVRSEEVGQRLVRLGQRARLGVGDRVVDLGNDPVADPLRVGVVEDLCVSQEALEARDWIRAPSCGNLLLRAVRLRITLEVPHPTDRVRLDERWPVAAPPS